MLLLIIIDYWISAKVFSLCCFDVILINLVHRAQAKLVSKELSAAAPDIDLLFQ